MMAEQIIARFLSHKDMLLQWLVLDHSNTGEIQQGTLQDLAQTAGENLVTLLYPAAEVLLLDIDLPVKSNKQIKKALPFALEELLADEMETYHLVWHRQVKGKVYVAAVNQEKFKRIFVQCTIFTGYTHGIQGASCMTQIIQIGQNGKKTK